MSELVRMDLLLEKKIPNPTSGRPPTIKHRLSHQGWAEVTQKRSKPTGKVFVAMSFDKSLLPVKDAIATAVRLAGYNPLRVDDEAYTGAVVDKILSHIRESQFVVADFTQNRNGVYYEAGFAAGLGIQVIHTCREDHLDRKGENFLHFDIAHMVAAPWKESELPRFTEELQLHIQRLFGKGPVVEPSGS